MQVKPKDIAEILGGAKVLGRAVNTLADLDAVVSAGLPLASEQSVRQKLAGDLLLQVSTGSSKEMDKPSSEVLERIARMFLYAEQVFGHQARASDFLHTPHPLLYGATPLAKLHSELGGREVEAILDSLAYGLPA